MALLKTKHRSSDFATTEKSGAASVEIDILLSQQKVRDDLAAVESLYDDVVKSQSGVELVEPKP